VSALGIIKLQSAGERLWTLSETTLIGLALQPSAVPEAHAGQRREPLAASARDAPPLVARRALFLSGD
jgi:hypothetical protein